MAICEGKINEGIYNCYGEYDESLCFDCIHNADNEGTEKSDNKFKSYVDAFNELFEFLKGEGLPEGTHCKMPKLKPDRAFTVIWFLQEHMRCLPASIEMCQGCKCLYDSDSEGISLCGDYKLMDDNGELTDKPVPKKYWGNWCDGCVPEIEFGC